MNLSPFGVVPPCTELGDGRSIIPTCLWGRCVDNQTCACSSGFQHDLVASRFLNCGLPTWVPIAGAGLTIFLNLLGTFVGLYVAMRLAKPRSIMQKIAGLASFTCFFFLLTSISLIATYPVVKMPWYGAVFNDLSTGSAALMCGMVVTSAIAPVATFARIKNERFFQIISWYVLPGFVLVGCLICTTVGYASGSDQIITEWMGVVFLIFALGCGLYAPVLFVFLTYLLRALDETVKVMQHRPELPVAVAPASASSRLAKQTSEVVPSGEEFPEDAREDGNGGEDERRDRISSRWGVMVMSAKQRMSLPKPRAPSVTERFEVTLNEDPVARAAQTREKNRKRMIKLRSKVRWLRFTSVLASSVVATFSFAAAVFQFAARTIPFSWLFYYAVTTLLAFFCLQISHYAKRESAEQPTKTSIQSSSTDHRFRGGNQATMVPSERPVVRPSSMTSSSWASPNAAQARDADGKKKLDAIMSVAPDVVLSEEENPS